MRYFEFKSDDKSGAERLADSTLSLRRSIYNRILANPFGKLNLQVYRFAAGKGVEVDNPAEALARRAYATFVPRERHLSRHEIKALLDAIEQTGTASTLRLAVRFMPLTGVRKGEFVVFVGPSGCGKSTLLRMIAGLNEIDGSRLYLDGATSRRCRPVSATWPSAARSCAQLQVFLFDEPISNLDAALRSQTRVEIHHLHHVLGATTIYVTHDQVEAMTPADRIAVLRDGQVDFIEALGVEELVYVTTAPGSRIVARQPVRSGLRAGDRVHLRVDAHKIHWFDAQGRVI